MRLFGSKIEKKCIDNTAITATQMNKLNDIFCISLGWLNNAVFGKEFAVGF